MKTFNCLKSLFIFIILILLFIVACGNSSDDGSKKLPNKIIKIDLSTEKLPVNYEGDNIEELYNRLFFQKPENKSQYETTEEYNKRIGNRSGRL